MNTRFIIALSAALMCALSIEAKVYDTLVLDDEFQLAGRIIERVPGESITIIVDNIKGKIKEAYIDKKLSHDTSDGYLIRLNDAGKEAYGIGNQPSLDKYIDASILHSVNLRKQGSVYEYESFLKGDENERRFEVDIQNVVSIISSPRDFKAKRGLLDIIETHKDKYSGQIVENILGEMIVVMGTNGTKYEINSDDVVSMRKEALNQNEDIFKQAELLDQVYIKSKKEPIIGIITEKRFDEYSSDNDCLVIITKDGNEVEVNMNEIAKYNYIINNGYRAHPLDFGEVWICGKKGHTVIPDKSGANFQVHERAMRDNMITIKYSDLDNQEIVIEHKNEDQFKTPYLIYCNPKSVSNKIYNFSPEELMRHTVPESWHTSLDQPDIERHYKLNNKPAVGTNNRYLLFYMTDSGAMVYIINITN